jgi:hypothetical protein
MADPEDDGDERPGHAPGLRKVLETACSELSCRLEDLTVLNEAADPYRLDTPLNHRNGQWAARQVERFFQPSERVHLRGLHYAIVILGNVRKPDRTIYRNTEEDWRWLVEMAMKAARWLGYVSFERIRDQRNDEPVIYRANKGLSRGVTSLDAAVLAGEITFELGGARVLGPWANLSNFDRAQPYALAIFGEKSSLEGILLPIAQSYGADMYLETGEMSDTHLYRLAKDASQDGRPLVVFTITDFDPAGRQMAVSIGRKLQGLRTLLFPALRFEVVPAAVTVEQVREFGLPSTPVKAGEQRRDRWRQFFGVEQTEVDAMIRARPDDLRRIVTTAIAPYYDETLNRRITRARYGWEMGARAVIGAHVDAEVLAEINATVEAIQADAERRIEALRAEVEERVAVQDARLKALVEDIQLPDPPPVPDAELVDRPPGSVLVTTDWSWAEQTQALRRHKRYGQDEP